MKVVLVYRKNAHRFLEMPRFIYRNDPNWIPHLIQDVKKVFDPKKNKLFSNGKLQRWILEEKEGKVIGRIAAFVNKKYADSMDFPTGGIGFFECIDDQEAANLLFDTAIQWLENEGMKAVDGSINFGEKNMFWGVLTENFTDMNSYGMNYNLPYYQKLFENYGFQTYYNQFCYKRDPLGEIQDVFVEKSKRIRKNPAYSFSDIRGKSTEKVAHDFMTVYNNAWAGHHGFKKMSLVQAEKTLKSMKPVMDKRTVFFTYHNNNPIAFFVSIPELNEIFQHVNGNLNWLGKLKFLYHKWKGTSKTLVGLVFGVDRKYHGMGVEGALIKFSSECLIKQDHYKNSIMTWIGDFNPKMISTVEALDAKKYRTLKTYRYMIDKSIPFERIKTAK